MSLLIAEECCWKNLDPNGKVTLEKKESNDTQIYTVLGSIVMDIISDHAHYAAEDGYSKYRWDVAEILPIVKQKAIGYYAELKANKRQFKFKDIL